MKKNIGILALLINCYVNAQDLSLNLEKGKTYTLSTTNMVTIVQHIDGKEEKTVNFETGAFSFRLLEHRDSLFLMETRLLHVALESESGSSRLVYSSEKDDRSDTVSTILREQINKPFRVLLGNDLIWKEVYGYDTVLRNAIYTYPISTDKEEQIQNLIRESGKWLVGPPDMIMTAIYGHHPRDAKGIWSVFTETSTTLPTNDSLSYYFSDIYGDRLVIKGSGTLTSVFGSQINGSPTDYRLTGRADATITLDKNTKWISIAYLNTEMKGHVEVNTGLGKVVVPMTITTNAIITGY
ncbi:MAG TPA: DUF6263 family protein [Flavisolibacter sp.]|nr:DUF6263 family protein [Flavisolibacter sp.]